MGFIWVCKDVEGYIGFGDAGESNGKMGNEMDTGLQA